MKLKTLKDIELNIGGHEDIRKEAIKWVQEENKLYRESLETVNFKIPILKSPRVTMFMEFHNITEEDLK